MGIPILPTPAEYLTLKVRGEYARLKRNGIKSVDFRQLMLNVINREGINDPTTISRLMGEISEIFKKWKEERSGGQRKLPLRSPRRNFTS